MPRRLNKRCGKAGCPNLVAPGVAYCSKHTVSHGRDYDKSRASSSGRGYGAVWQKARRIQLSKYPLCELCGRPADTVHHKIPVKLGGKHQESNLMSLCTACHNKVEKRSKVEKGSVE